MTYQCEVKELAPQPTLGIRKTTSVENMSAMLGEAYGAGAQYMGELGEYPGHGSDIYDVEVVPGGAAVSASHDTTLLMWPLP